MNTPISSHCGNSVSEGYLDISIDTDGTLISNYYGIIYNYKLPSDCLIICLVNYPNLQDFDAETLKILETNYHIVNGSSWLFINVTCNFECYTYIGGTGFYGSTVDNPDSVIGMRNKMINSGNRKCIVAYYFHDSSESFDPPGDDEALNPYFVFTPILHYVPKSVDNLVDEENEMTQSDIESWEETIDNINKDGTHYYIMEIRETKTKSAKVKIF